jgi:hypothetical protein
MNACSAVFIYLISYISAYVSVATQRDHGLEAVDGLFDPRRWQRREVARGRL